MFTAGEGCSQKTAAYCRLVHHDTGQGSVQNPGNCAAEEINLARVRTTFRQSERHFRHQIGWSTRCVGVPKTTHSFGRREPSTASSESAVLGAVSTPTTPVTPTTTLFGCAVHRRPSQLRRNVSGNKSHATLNRKRMSLRCIACQKRAKYFNRRDIEEIDFSAVCCVCFPGETSELGSTYSLRTAQPTSIFAKWRGKQDMFQDTEIG